MSNSTLKLHNAMWPGLVGKEPGTDHPPISLDNMLDFTVKAQVNGQKFDGVDLFLFHSHTGLEPLVSLRYFGPHTNIDAPAIGDYRKKKR